MADKVVQLKDKNDNNLYPIAGGLMQQAIDTDMIKDGAVTSDKIDFTTFGSVALFLRRETSITNYSYTVPAGIKMAFLWVYIDMYNMNGAFEVTLNGSLLSQVLESTRGQASAIVKSGDIIVVRRVSGNADPFHQGFIRKIF